VGIRLYKPAVFQGSLKKKNYFEGWYFKLLTKDPSHTYSIIPGVSLVENDPHAFIQIMDGYSGYTDYARYSLDQFIWQTGNLYIKIGESVFTDNGMMLDIKTESTTLNGRIDFLNIVRYPGSIFSPGIMGWYSFVPFMECKHGIVSVNHDLSGKMSVNGNLLDLDGGKGYIEKDWGTSFPEAWIWIQCNNFDEHDVSFMLSIAKIPWLGRFFIGLISFLYFDNKYYMFSTYNRSTFSDVRNNKEKLEITLKNNSHKLKVSVVKNSFCDLVAPVQGEMSRRIKESIDSELQIQLFNKGGEALYTGTGRNVGLEVTDKIFRYFS
jgi:tocopherol cyclase